MRALSYMFLNLGLTGSMPTELGLLASVKTMYALRVLRLRVLGERGWSPHAQSVRGDQPCSPSLSLRLALNTALPTLHLAPLLPGGVDSQLAVNKLAGTLPTELGNLPLLNWMQLSQTQMGGSLPTEIGRVTTFGFTYVLSALVPAGRERLRAGCTRARSSRRAVAGSAARLLACALLTSTFCARVRLQVHVRKSEPGWPDSDRDSAVHQPHPAVRAPGASRFGRTAAMRVGQIDLRGCAAPPFAHSVQSHGCFARDRVLWANAHTGTIPKDLPVTLQYLCARGRMSGRRKLPRLGQVSCVPCCLRALCF